MVCPNINLHSVIFEIDNWPKVEDAQYLYCKTKLISERIHTVCWFLNWKVLQAAIIRQLTFLFLSKLITLFLYNEGSSWLFCCCCYVWIRNWIIHVPNDNIKEMAPRGNLWSNHISNEGAVPSPITTWHFPLTQCTHERPIIEYRQLNDNRN